MAVQVTRNSADDHVAGAAARAPLSPTARAVAVAALLVFSILAAGLVVRTWRSTPSFDFGMMYTRARGLRAGENLYACSRRWQAERYTFWLPGRVDPCGAYMYAPVFAFMVVPLTELPYEAARLTWFAVGVLSVAAATMLLARLMYRQPGVGQIALATAMFAVLLALRPVSSSLRLGQTDALVLLALTLALSLYVGRHTQLSAVSLSVALLIKPLFWPLIVLLLLKREYRAVAIVAAIGLGGILLSTLTVGVDAMRDFVETTRYFTSAWAAVTPQNQSLYSLTLRLFTVNAFTRPLAHAAGVALAAKVLAPIASAGALLLLVRGIRGDTRQTRKLEFGVGVGLSLLASPFYEHTHASYLVIPLFMAGSAAWAWPHSRRRWLVLGGTAAVLALLALPRLEDVSLAFYRFRVAPMAPSLTLLTGVYLYAAFAATVVVAVALVLQRRVQRQRSAAATAVA